MTGGPFLFLTFWPAAAIAATAEEAGGGSVRAATAGLYLFNFGGVDIPLLTAGFAVLGVLLARPLSPKGAQSLGTAKNLLVTVILALLALFWVIDSRPGLLFAFIVSIGLGFSGFAIIELLGAEVLAFLRRLIDQLSNNGGRNG